MLRVYVDLVCRHAFTLALAAAAWLLLLAPLHQAGTHHVNISRTLADQRVEAPLPAGRAGVEVGDELPVFRFNPNWKRDIGWVRVESVDDGVIVASYDPDGFAWPMGVQGQVVSMSGEEATLNIGSEVGLLLDQLVKVFDGRRQVATLRIVYLDNGRALARPEPGTERTVALRDLVGMTATRYSVPNQLAWLAYGEIAALEWISGALVLGLWLWSWFSPLPGRGLAAAAGVLAATVRRLGGLPHARTALHVLVGPAVVWALGRFLWLAVLYVVASALHEVGVRIPQLSDGTLGDAGQPVVWLLGAALYYGTLERTGRSPVAVLWDRIRYKKVDLSWLPVPRGFVLWCLHLVVFWFFASTLTGFLGGNLTAIGKLGWAGAELSFRDLGRASESLGHMLTHAPAITSADQVFSMVRYSLWSLTICGCLFGYGHTVASILWTRKAIRNMDFTVAGWITNGMCYGPLFGVVLWKLLPDLSGVDPIIADGPLLWAMRSVELLLNLLYTLSIWNLGKMFGVMVDKGVRTTGFYSVVRHPSYTLEAFMFISMELAGFTGPLQWIAGGSYLFKYWLRSEREDVFMGVANPDYVEYRKAVPYKFLPGIW